MLFSRMNVVMRDVKSFQFISLCLFKIESVSLRFLVRVVVFPLQPFYTQQQKQQNRWIDKFIVFINNSQFIYLIKPTI
jgi:hypothetical protein